MKDNSRFLGCESPQEKRDRTMREKLAAQEVLQRASGALETFERAVFRQEQTPETEKRRSQLRRARQEASDRLDEAEEAFFFCNRVTREEKATRPPRYKPELDKGDGSWTRR